MLNKTFIVSILVFFSLLGCAASGANDSSSSSARASSTSPNAQKVCNAGEILHCASSHHIESAMVVMAETIIKAKSVCVFLREIYKVWKGQ